MENKTCSYCGFNGTLQEMSQHLLMGCKWKAVETATDKRIKELETENADLKIKLEDMMQRHKQDIQGYQDELNDLKDRILPH